MAIDGVRFVLIQPLLNRGTLKRVEAVAARRHIDEGAGVVHNVQCQWADHLSRRRHVSTTLVLVLMLFCTLEQSVDLCAVASLTRFVDDLKHARTHVPGTLGGDWSSKVVHPPPLLRGEHLLVHANDVAGAIICRISGGSHVVRDVATVVVVS